MGEQTYRLENYLNLERYVRFIVSYYVAAGNEWRWSPSPTTINSEIVVTCSGFLYETHGENPITNTGTWYNLSDLVIPVTLDGKY